MDLLTSDSIATRRAGMTYGKWKALHPHTEVNEENEENEVLDKDAKLCAICGKPIRRRDGGSGSLRRKYCSPDCAYEGTVVKNREFARRKRERLKANGKI